MFKHWMEIVHNHDNGYRDWLFYQLEHFSLERVNFHSRLVSVTFCFSPLLFQTKTLANSVNVN